MNPASINHLEDVHFWASLSCYESETGFLSFHLTKDTGNGHIDGRHRVSPSAPDFPFWSWLYEIRHSIPSYFEGRHLYSLRHYFDAGKRGIALPENGLYFITAAWSGQANGAKATLQEKMALTKLSVPVHFIDTESEDVDRMFPQLRPFLHGWGEVFLFINGRCDGFFSAKAGLESFSSNIHLIFRTHAC